MTEIDYLQPRDGSWAGLGKAEWIVKINELVKAVNDLQAAQDQVTIISPDGRVSTERNVRFGNPVDGLPDQKPATGDCPCECHTGYTMLHIQRNDKCPCGMVYTKEQPVERESEETRPTGECGCRSKGTYGPLILCDKHSQWQSNHKPSRQAKIEELIEKYAIRFDGSKVFTVASLRSFAKEIQELGGM